MTVREHGKIVLPKSTNSELLNYVKYSIDIANAMNECIWIGDKDHKTLYVNSVYEETSGYTLQECIGQKADFCFDETSKKTIAEHHELRRKGLSSRYEATMISKDGKKIPMLISGTATKTGEIIGVFINLTKVKKLTKQEALTKKILHHTGKAFIILDQKRKITLWNNGAKKLFGYKEYEVLDKSIDTIIPPDEKEKNICLVSEVEKRGHISNIETKRIKKNGKIIDVSVSVTKVMDDDKNFIGYLLSYVDITQQKQDTDELQKRFETIQDAYKELGLQKRHLDYFCEIADMGAGPESLESLERLITSALSMLTKCDGIVFRSYQEKSNKLILKYCLGVNQNWHNKSKISFKNSLAEEAFNKKRALIIDNINRCKKHQSAQLLKDHNFKTGIILPLFINEELLDTISLYATDPSKFRFIETTFLENIAKLCSLAIHSKKSQKLYQK